MSGLGVIVFACMMVGIQGVLVDLSDDENVEWQHSAYNCSIYGDPHEHDWTQQTFPLSLPCPYVVTRFELKAAVSSQWSKIRVEVTASNNPAFINGRFYVNIVCVSITYWEGGQKNPNTIRFYVGKSNKLPEEWEAGGQLRFVKIKYSPNDRKARLLIYNNEDKDILMMKVVVRLPKRAEGNFQRQKPMLVVWVDREYLIYDSSIKVPVTVCSTVNDTDSVPRDEKNYGVSNWLLGVYYILQEPGPFFFPNIDPLCSTLKETFETCQFPQCFELLKPKFLKKCFGPRSSLDVLKVLDECLKANCYPGDYGMTHCNFLTDFAESCPSFKRYVKKIDNCKSAPKMQKPAK